MEKIFISIPLEEAPNDVRAAYVSRQDVPAADLVWAAKDGNCDVRAAYVSRQDVPAADLVWAAKDGNWDVRAAYVSRQDVPAADLVWAAKDDDCDVRRAYQLKVGDEVYINSISVEFKGFLKFLFPWDIQALREALATGRMPFRCHFELVGFVNRRRGANTGWVVSDSMNGFFRGWLAYATKDNNVYAGLAAKWLDETGK